MTASREHIIGKLSFDIDMGFIPFKTEEWESLTIYSQEKLIPVIEKRMHELDKTKTNVFIEKIVLKLNLTISDHWEISLKKAFEKALEIEFNNLPQFILKTNPVDMLSSNLSALYYFMEYGAFPWFYSQKEIKIFETSCLDNLTYQISKTLVNSLIEKPIYLRRLLTVFTDDFLHKLLKFYGLYFKEIPTRDSLYKSLIKINSKQVSNNVFRTIYWEGLLLISKKSSIKNDNIINDFIVFILKKCSYDKRSSKNDGIDIKNSPLFDKKVKLLLENMKIQGIQIQETIQEDTIDLKGVIKQNDSIKFTHQTKNEKPVNGFSEINREKLNSDTIKISNLNVKPEANDILDYNSVSDLYVSGISSKLSFDPKDGLYLNHAGIILVHPFLERFFKVLKLFKDNEWISSKHAKRGVQFLAYMATGHKFCPEYEMIFFKCICGLPLDTFVEAQFDISKEEEIEINKLLSSLIKHWSVLKDTSIEGLRTTFFNREGKLIQKDNNWNVFVEQKAHDILLNRLPWNLSTVSLPWLPNLILVSWT